MKRRSNIYNQQKELPPDTSKIKHPTYVKYLGRGHRLLKLYCERCRIKDGLGNTGLKYGICSFCGWKGRCHIGPYWQHYRPIRTPKSTSSWRWNRGNNPWSRNRKDR